MPSVHTYSIDWERQTLIGFYDYLSFNPSSLINFNYALIMMHETSVILFIFLLAIQSFVNGSYG